MYYDDFFPNLGDPVRAEKAAQRYLELAQGLADADSLNTAARFSVAIAWALLSTAARFRNPVEGVSAGAGCGGNHAAPALTASRLPRVMRARA